MITILVVLLVLIAVGLGFFAVQNDAASTFHLWSWSWHGPVYYPVIGAALAVLLAFLIYSVVVGTKWRFRHWSLHRSRLGRDSLIEELRAENLRLRRQRDAVAQQATARDAAARDATPGEAAVRERAPAGEAPRRDVAPGNDPRTGTRA